MRLGIIKYYDKTALIANIALFRERPQPSKTKQNKKSGRSAADRSRVHSNAPPIKGRRPQSTGNC